jgi:hypothetical protein
MDPVSLCDNSDVFRSTENLLSQRATSLLGAYKRVVVWGLRREFHTHRYIHKHFYDTLGRLGVPRLWLDDSPANQRFIESGDLVISVNVAGKHLVAKEGVDYCLHNFDPSDDLFKRIAPQNTITLQVYTNSAETDSGEQWDEVTIFGRDRRTLYQPWGTDLLYEDFKIPTLSRLPIMFWVGSIWNNEQNQGNLSEIAELRRALKNHGIRFTRLCWRVPNWVNVLAVRRSRIAPAIAGAWQVENDYLPCRMFKNISYGQLGVTNVRKFSDLLGDSFVPGETIEELVDRALSLSRSEYRELASAQQERIRRHTYREKLENICRALALIKT